MLAWRVSGRAQLSTTAACCPRLAAGQARVPAVQAVQRAACAPMHLPSQRLPCFHLAVACPVWCLPTDGRFAGACPLSCPPALVVGCPACVGAVRPALLRKVHEALGAGGHALPGAVQPDGAADAADDAAAATAAEMSESGGPGGGRWRKLAGGQGGTGQNEARPARDCLHGVRRFNSLALLFVRDEVRDSNCLLTSMSCSPGGGGGGSWQGASRRGGTQCAQSARKTPSVADLPRCQRAPPNPEAQRYGMPWMSCNPRSPPHVLSPIACWTPRGTEPVLHAPSHAA